MACKFCGKELRWGGSSLLAGSDARCQLSPSKRHISLPNPPHCIYCGFETKLSANKLYARSSPTCRASPTGNHGLC